MFGLSFVIQKKGFLSEKKITVSYFLLVVASFVWVALFTRLTDFESLALKPTRIHVYFSFLMFDLFLALPSIQLPVAKLRKV